jgi:hypothetical protein
MKIDNKSVSYGNLGKLAVTFGKSSFVFSYRSGVNMADTSTPFEYLEQTRYLMRKYGGISYEINMSFH